MIYLDARALLKFIKREPETDALRSWLPALPVGMELLTSELSGLEITRTLLRAGVDYQRVPYFTQQALRGVYLVDLSSTVLRRAMSTGCPGLGSLDAIHLASTDPFRLELVEFVTYDQELTRAATTSAFLSAAPEG